MGKSPALRSRFGAGSWKAGKTSRNRRQVRQSPSDVGGQVGGRLHRALISGRGSRIRSPTMTIRTEIQASGWEYEREGYPARLTAGGRAGISEVLFGYFSRSLPVPPYGLPAVRQGSRTTGPAFGNSRRQAGIPPRSGIQRAELFKEKVTPPLGLSSSSSPCGVIKLSAMYHSPPVQGPDLLETAQESS
jgi:hypothetical protein